MNAFLPVRQNSLFEAAFPSIQFWQKILLVFVGSGLMALCSRLTLPLPFTPVPITGQTFGVLFLAALLGARLSLAIQSVYILQGLAGLPVFSAGATWGVARLLGPTGGYLVGFLAASWVVGSLVDRGYGKNFFSAVWVLLLGQTAMFLIALPWLKFVLPGTWGQAISLGLWPFLLGDLFKMVCVALLLPAGWGLLRKLNSERI